MTTNPTVIAERAEALTEKQRSDRAILRQERAEALKELMNTGNLMSNMCFNLKQRRPDEFATTGVADRYIKVAGALQQQWDAAEKRYREATQKEK